MVAPEAFREAGLGEVPSPGWQGGSIHLTVREVRELIASGPVSPDFLIALTRDPRVTVRRMGFKGLAGGDLASNEDIFREGGILYIGGVDEAGRGALAGPLVAAAVMFDPGVVVEGVDDSKALLPERREEIYVEIVERALSVSVAFVDATLVDRWGIQPVNMKALGDAVAGLGGECQCVICDHFSLKGLEVPAYGVPKADAIFQSVAAASIVAKVERDRVMTALDARYRLYHFSSNKGYATPDHLEALAVHGPSDVHRMSFNGVLPDDEAASLW